MTKPGVTRERTVQAAATLLALALSVSTCLAGPPPEFLGFWDEFKPSPNIAVPSVLEPYNVLGVTPEDIGSPCRQALHRNFKTDLSELRLGEGLDALNHLRAANEDLELMVHRSNQELKSGYRKKSQTIPEARDEFERRFAILKAKGYVKIGETEITRRNKGGVDKVPFYQILMPKAFTGFYHLKDLQFNPSIHKGLMVVMPGIGSTFSNALTVTKFAKTLSGNTFKPEWGDTGIANTPTAKFAPRYYSVPLDMPLNGMGSDAPGSFATAEGTLAVLRHCELIMMYLYPGLPLGVAGRSQGALIAMA